MSFIISLLGILLYILKSILLNNRRIFNLNRILFIFFFALQAIALSMVLSVMGLTVAEDRNRHHHGSGWSSTDSSLGGSDWPSGDGSGWSSTDSSLGGSGNLPLQ